jgi:ABC-type glycerol-3-phosphate transport system substrate-binding protein
MSNPFKSQPARSKSAQLREDLGRAIRDGDLAPGDRIPSNRQLAAQYGMSHVAVGQAISQFVDDGLIVKRHGSGTFVAQHPTGETGTLRIYDGASTMHVVISQAVDAWSQQHPDARVVRVDSAEQADVRILSSSCLDVRHQPQMLQAINDYTPSLRVLGDTFHPFLIDAVRHGREVYALPLWFTPEVLAYNRAMIGRHAERIDYWTLDDMLAAADALGPTLNPRQIRPCSVVKRFRYQVFPLLSAFGAAVADASQSRCLLGEPESVEALMHAQALAQTMPDWAPGDSSNIDDLLAGRLAIKTAGSLVVSRFASVPDLDLAIAPYPTGRRPGGILTGVWAGITAWCRQPQRAWQLIDFLVSAETQQAMADADVLFPARREACQSLLTRHGGLYDAVYRSAMAPNVQPSGLSGAELSFIDSQMREWWSESDPTARLQRVAELVNARLYQASPDDD